MYLLKSCEKLLQLDHIEHEDIIRTLQERADPFTIPYLKSAIELKPQLEYLSYDDYGGYYKKMPLGFTGYRNFRSYPIDTRTYSFRNRYIGRTSKIQSLSYQWWNLVEIKILVEGNVLKAIYKNEKFSLVTHHQIPNEDITHQNIDFWIKTDGKTYLGSATTTENIQYLMEKDKQTGESAFGSYHWQTNAIILKDFTVESLALAVEDIIKESLLDSIFHLILNDD